MQTPTLIVYAFIVFAALDKTDYIILQNGIYYFAI